MARTTINRLSDRRVKAATAGMHADGGGLRVDALSVWWCSPPVREMRGSLGSDDQTMASQAYKAKLSELANGFVRGDG